METQGDISGEAGQLIFSSFFAYYEFMQPVFLAPRATAMIAARPVDSLRLAIRLALFLAVQNCLVQHYSALTYSCSDFTRFSQPFRNFSCVGLLATMSRYACLR